MQYQIRSMSLGEILDTGFSIVRNHFVSIVGIAAVVYIPLALLGAAFPTLKPGAPPSPAVLVGLLVGGLGFLLLSPIGTVAITYLIGELYQGRSTTIGGAFRQALSILLPLLGTTLLSGLMILLACVLLLVPVILGTLIGKSLGGIGVVLSVLLFLASGLPAVWVALGFIVLSQVMIFERIFGTAGINRSLWLMRGNRLRALGVLILGFIVAFVLGFAFHLASGVVPYAGPIASGLASAIGNAFIAAVTVVLYFDIRCRKEAFEIEHLAGLVRADAAPPQPAR